MTPEYPPIPDPTKGLRGVYDVVAVGIGAAGFVDARRSRVLFAPHLARKPLGRRVTGQSPPHNHRGRPPLVFGNLHCRGLSSPGAAGISALNPCSPAVTVRYRGSLRRAAAN